MGARVAGCGVVEGRVEREVRVGRVIGDRVGAGVEVEDGAVGLRRFARGGAPGGRDHREKEKG